MGDFGMGFTIATVMFVVIFLLTLISRLKVVRE
jgi:ABC-type sugar transport system permease subunit